MFDGNLKKKVQEGENQWRIHMPIYKNQEGEGMFSEIMRKSCSKSIKRYHFAPGMEAAPQDPSHQ